jgi:ATP-dependent RNA circularization protein (DNA/RNA ligase family)
MTEYHKIQTVFKRDPDTKFKTLLEGDYTLPAFEFLKGNPWVFTEKVDGTNIRVIIDDGISFGGKTDAAQVPATLLEKLHRIFDPLTAKLLEMFPDGACLYGEGYGPKIQKGGGNYGPEQGFVLFDVKVAQWWLERPNIESIAEKLALRVVPIIGEGTLVEMVERTRAGFNSVWGVFEAEGIVARPKCELATRNGERIITKIKTRDFAR